MADNNNDLKEFFGSIYNGFSERVSSPLVSSYLISWLLWNGNAVLIALSSSPIKQKLGLLYKHFHTLYDWQFYLLTTIGPLITTLLWIYAYPPIAKILLPTIYSNRQRIRDLRIENEKQTIFTEDMVARIRREHLRQEKKLAAELKSAEEKIEQLNAEVESLEKIQAAATPAPDFYDQVKALDNSDVTGLDQDANSDIYEGLTPIEIDVILAIGDYFNKENTDMINEEILYSISEPKRLVVQNALNRLVSKKLIQNTIGTLQKSYYFTKAGLEAYVQISG